MTQQEIIDYNKRCAEFLGCTFQIKSLFEFAEDKETVFYEEFSKPLWWNNSYNHRYGFLSYQQTKYMIYHSDWNWIMQVVEAIEKLEFRFEIAYNQVDLECMRPDLDRFSYHINLHNCVGYGNDLHLTKKESVVKAINQFLIWYNENK